MGISLIIAALILLILGVMYLRGSRKLKERNEKFQTLGEQRGKEIDILGNVTYHGGFSRIPKPQKLTAALTDSDLVLQTGKGQVEVLPLKSWLKIDKFTTQAKGDPKKRSLILWGPFQNMVSANQKRHFIAVQYREQDGQDNHILLEIADLDRLGTIFDAFSRRKSQCNI
ncbi:MAG: hypothetical protein PHN75_12920 [Syntrophales bacterium]|nr:hypothetical protein [Syntrophales bacterium]